MTSIIGLYFWVLERPLKYFLNILKNHPKSLLLLLSKRKSYDLGKLQTESKFLSAKRQRPNTNKINEENVNDIDYDKNLMNNLEKLEKELPLNEENINSENFCKYDQFLDNELDPYKTNAQVRDCSRSSK